MNTETLIDLISQTIRTLNPEIGVIGGYSYNTTYESITVSPMGHEKPPKEAFEAKFQELVAVHYLQGSPPRAQQAPRRGGLDFL